MKKAITTVLPIFLCILYNSSVFAEEIQKNEEIVTKQSEDSLSEMSLEELLNVKVKTGSFLDMNLEKSPFSITVINKEQIDVSGSRHLGELLEIYVPGFQYMINKWNGDIWGMRGIAVDRNTKIIFLVNGLKMNHESRDGAFSEINLGLLGDVERVEVLRGPAGLVYGSGAISGVVNVVTKRPDKTTANASASYGSWNSKIFEAFSHSQFDKDKSMSVSVGFRSSDGIGNGNSRVFGNNSWPNNGDSPSPNGEPTDGSAWFTPGNMKFAADLKLENFSLYSRFTRQIHSTGQFFIVDPWPEIVGSPDATSAKKTIDGKQVDNTSPLASTESFGNNRRLNMVDNLSFDARYSLPIEDDKLNLQAAFIGVTNRISTDYRKDYQIAGVEPRAGFISQSIGEKRYLTSAQYLMNRVDNLNSAFGVEFRIDDLGKDLDGINMNDGIAKKNNISNVLYTNLALYTENLYSLNTKIGDFDFVGGVRFDKHTRTDGIFSPKAAVIYSPDKNNSIKAIFQGSANNGSADNYEYNWRHYDANGNVSKVPQLENPKSATSNILPAVTEAELHSLKPETIYSYELTSNHKIGNYVNLIPSISYNSVYNLFVWNQELFRVVNGKPFNFLNIEGDMNFKYEGLTLGVSHTFQKPVNVVREKQTFQTPEVKIVPNPNIKDEFIPQVTGNTKTVEVDSVGSQITSDNNNFLNLVTNISKFYLTYKPSFEPLRFITLHTNVRTFWGLQGRDSLYLEDEKKGDNYLNLSRMPMVKWNASIHFALPLSFNLSAYAYDILGTSNNLNGARWQQSAEPSQRELYTVDQQSFAVKLEKNF